MRVSWHAVRILTLAGGVLFAAPAAASAQAPRVSPAAANQPVRGQGSNDLRVPPIDLIELSRYAGWGGTIGAGLGLAYGLAFERGPLKGVEVVADTLIGFTGGLFGGAAVYVARLAFGRS